MLSSWWSCFWHTPPPVSFTEPIDRLDWHRACAQWALVDLVVIVVLGLTLLGLMQVVLMRILRARLRRLLGPLPPGAPSA